MKKRLSLILVLFLTFSAVAPGQTTRPVSAIHQALIVSVDGLRPDVLLRANAPTIRRLMHDGSFTFWAETTDLAITLPSHTSMLTGVTPFRHGIDWNTDKSVNPAEFPRSPTLFELAKRAGYSTALVAGKSKFSILARSGSVDWLGLPGKSRETDQQVITTALDIFKAHHPAILFVHFPGPDAVGHAVGWGTADQLAVVEKIDGFLDQLLSAYAQAGLADSTVVLVTADHGGTVRKHGANDPRSRYIPWIIAGPGIRHDLDLTTISSLRVHIEDTFATVCFLMGIPLPSEIDGKAVKQVVQR